MFFPESGFLKLRHEQRIHQSETLYFTVRASDPKARDLSEDLELEWNGRRFWIAEMLKGRRDAEATVEVEAPAIWTKLADKKHVGTLTFAGNDLEDIVTFVLAAHAPDWTLEIISPANPAKAVSFESNDASVLDILRKIAKVTGYELEFDTGSKIIRYHTALGVTRGLGFTYGRNLIEVERRSNPPEVTRLWPFGKDKIGIGLVHPDNLPYVEDYSFYTAQGLTLAEARERFTKEEIYSDTNFIDAQALYDAAVERLDELSSATVTYTMGVVDLTTLTASAEDDYDIGDTVLVTDDELHFTNVPVRVVRIERHPLEPWRSELELSYLPVVAPDPDVGAHRGDSTQQWELFASRNTSTARYVGAVRTVLNRLIMNSVEGAQWVIGYSLNAIATGTGTITIEAVDANAADAPFHPPYELEVTDGDPVHLHFSLGDIAVPAGSYNLIVRAEGTGGGELSIPEDGTALWILAKGTTQNALTLSDSIRYDYTGAIQEFTVPDDVSEITIEAHGAQGGNTIGDQTGGLGGMVTATFTVLPGEIYDVYVGGWTNDNLGTSPNGGWPDGGDSLGAGAGGGGRSEVRPDAGAITDALIIAGAGGGEGSGDIDHLSDVSGGDGGYPEGGDAPYTASPFGPDPDPSGGTQTGGGDGAGATASGNGAQGAGGDFVDDTEDPSFSGSPTTRGGAGGGGWFGGGAGAWGNGARGGGGGSGYVGDGAYDLEALNAENSGAGYVIISWQTPLDVT